MKYIIKDVNNMGGFVVVKDSSPEDNHSGVSTYKYTKVYQNGRGCKHYIFYTDTFDSEELRDILIDRNNYKGQLCHKIRTI